MATKPVVIGSDDMVRDSRRTRMNNRVVLKGQDDDGWAAAGESQKKKGAAVLRPYEDKDGLAIRIFRLGRGTGAWLWPGT